MTGLNDDMIDVKKKMCSLEPFLSEKNRNETKKSHIIK